MGVNKECGGEEMKSFPSVRFGLELYDEPKLEKIGEKFGIDGWDVADIWNRLQLFTRKHNPSGNIQEHSNEYLEKKLRCKTPGIIQAFRDIGWISPDGWVKDFHLWGGADLWYQVTNYQDKYPQHAEMHKYYSNPLVATQIPHGRKQATTSQPQDSPTTAQQQPPVLYCTVLSGTKRSKDMSVKKTTDSRVKILIDYFVTKFKEVCKEKYTVIGAKHGKLIKGILQKDEPVETYIALIDKYFAMGPDTWLGKRPKGIELFCHGVNEIKQQRVTPPGCLDPEDDYDEELYFDKTLNSWVCSNSEGLGMIRVVNEKYKPHKRGQPLVPDGGMYE